MDFGQKAVTLSKHWPGAYELRVRAPQKGHFFAQVGVKKATKNEDGKMRGKRKAKGRPREPKRSQTVDKRWVEKGEAKLWSGGQFWGSPGGTRGAGMGYQYMGCTYG